MQKVSLKLTLPQLKKLAKGQVVQVSGGALQANDNDLMLEIANFKKAMKNMKVGRGVRLQLSPDEIEASGLKELLQKGKALYKKYENDPLVMEGVKKARQILKKGVRYGVTGIAEALPFPLGTVARELDQKYGDQAVDLLGKVTGAYGMKRDAYQLTNSYSPMAIPAHPAMHPTGRDVHTQYVSVGNSGGSFSGAGCGCGCGGSFLPA